MQHRNLHYGRPTINVSFKAPSVLVNRLKKEARAHHRSLSFEVIARLERSLGNRYTTMENEELDFLG